MKKCLPLFCALALALALAACHPGPAEDPPDQEEPICLEGLSVEIPRAGLPAQDLAQAVRELPEALQEALVGNGVEVEAVAVTVSSSPEAAAQAVSEGGVDLAFLLREDYDALEKPPWPLLAAVPGSGEGAMVVIACQDDEVLSGEDFAEALAAAVNGLREGQPVFGPCDYAYLQPSGEIAQ